MHRVSTVLTELITKDACVSEIESSVTESEVTETAAGFTATVETFAAYQGIPCATPTGEATPTPMPHADLSYCEDATGSPTVQSSGTARCSSAGDPVLRVIEQVVDGRPRRERGVLGDLFSILPGNV